MSEDRIGVRKRVTRKTIAEGYESAEYWIERSRPSGVSNRDALVDVEAEINGALDRFRESGDQKPAERAKQNGEALDPVQLDKLPWQSMKKNPAAQWIFDNLPEASLLVQRLRETKEIILSGWKYQLSIPSGQEKGFVNRFPHKG